MQWLDPDFIFQTVLPALNRGLVMSIALIVPSATIGFVLGVLTGVARVFGPKWLRSLGNGFTTIFRGVPLVVQLMILYFGLPNLGIYLEPYPASVLGFILCTGAYQSEYVRGALLSIRQ
ncbi:MAG: ABC transporter permease subunit, partial [Bilophila wadsworthia]